MGNKFSWNQFGILRTCDDIEEYLAGQEWKHTNYFHYTSKDAAYNIIRKKEFWISSMHDSNDVEDANQFKLQEQYKTFELCFSTGISENLPLWYLYSGTEGKGARLRFTPGTIENIIQNGEYWLAEKTEDKDPIPIMRLDEKQAVIRFEDVLYYAEGEKPEIADIKYNTMTNHIMPYGDVKKYLDAHKGFGKGLIWYYEKETRLLITLNEGENAAKIIDEDTDAVENGLKKYVVLLRFGAEAMWKSIWQNVGLMFGPGMTKEEVEKERCSEAALGELKPERIGASKYAGTVRFRFKK